MIPNRKSNIAYADRVDWERAVERSCKRNLIAVERPRLVSEAPLDVPDPDTAIDAIQASLPALMVPVQEPDRAEWVRRALGAAQGAHCRSGGRASRSATGRVHCGR